MVYDHLPPRVRWKGTTDEMGVAQLDPNTNVFCFAVVLVEEPAAAWRTILRVRREWAKRAADTSPELATVSDPLEVRSTAQQL